MSIIMWVFFIVTLLHHLAPKWVSNVFLNWWMSQLHWHRKKNLLFWCTLIVSLKIKKNPVCSGVNLNCPRGAVWSKKAFMFYLIVKGTKSISKIKIHGPFLFWLENSSIIPWLCGSFYQYLWVGGQQRQEATKKSIILF